jgi:site-specific DNA-methyltransferase (adenine-specific)
MRWLVRLITPPGGVVLDPFAGSGTTLLAAEKERARCIAIEREPDYCKIVQARYRGHTRQLTLNL